MNPIHPALGSVAIAAKAKNWNALDQALSLALKKPSWLRPEHRVGDPAGYMRHVLYVDPGGGFVITAITWLPGQVSPVHGHHVWCVYGIAEGELTEEEFDLRSGMPEPGKKISYGPGDLAERDLECTRVHRVSNRSGRPLVALHLYGVAAERLTTGINRIYPQP